MERQPEYEQLCERYLLGELSEAEQAKLEEAYFADDSMFERFLAVKDDLVDAYARGDLTGVKLTRFEQHYLRSNARRQEVEDARDLIQVTSATAIETSTVKNRLSWWKTLAKSHPVAWRVGLVTAVVLLIAGSWIIVRQVRDSRARRAAEERARNVPKPPNEESANGNVQQGPSPTPSLDIGGERATASPSPPLPVKPEIAPKLPSPTSAAIASLTLLPFTTRDAGSANSLAISPEQRVVRLNLVFGDGVYESFEVLVRTVDGQQVVRRNGLKARSNETGKTVTLTFDSSLLDRQDYIATLRGRPKNGKPQTIGEYYFRVVFNDKYSIRR